MNQEPDRDGVSAPLPEPTQHRDEDAGAALSRPLQEHLARELRAEYQLVADKPAFLGDPALPVEFEIQLNRLDRRERVHERGVEAVKAALEIEDEAEPEGLPRPRPANDP